MGVSKYQLELLEPRVLLSADGAVMETPLESEGSASSALVVSEVLQRKDQEDHGSDAGRPRTVNGVDLFGTLIQEDLEADSTTVTIKDGVPAQISRLAIGQVPARIDPAAATPILLAPGKTAWSLPASGRGVVALWRFAGDARDGTFPVSFRMTSSLDAPQDFALVLYDADGNQLQVADAHGSGAGSLETLNLGLLPTGRVYHLAVVSQLLVPAGSYSVLAESAGARLSDPITMDPKTGRVSYATTATDDLFRDAADVHVHPLTLLNADQQVTVTVRSTLSGVDLQVAIYRQNDATQVLLGDGPIVPAYEFVADGSTTGGEPLVLTLRGPPGSTLSEEQFVIVAAPKGYEARAPSYRIDVAAELPLLVSVTPDRAVLTASPTLPLSPSTELGVAQAGLEKQTLGDQTERFYWFRVPKSGTVEIEVDAGFDAVVSVHHQSNYTPFGISTQVRQGVVILHVELESSGPYYVRVASNGPLDFRDTDRFDLALRLPYNWSNLALPVPQSGEASSTHGSVFIGRNTNPAFYNVLPAPGLDFITLQLSGGGSNQLRITVQGVDFRLETVAPMGETAVLPIQTMGRPDPLFVSLSSEVGPTTQGLLSTGRFVLPRELSLDALPGRKMATATGDVDQTARVLSGYGDRTGFAYYHLLTAPNASSRWEATADAGVEPLLVRYAEQNGVLRLQDWVLGDDTGHAVMERVLPSDRLYGVVVHKLGLRRDGSVSLTLDNPTPLPVGVGMVPDLVFENRPEFRFGSIGAAMQVIGDNPIVQGMEPQRYGYILKIEPITLGHDYEQDLWQTILPENFFPGSATEDPAWPVLRLAPETGGSTLQLKLTLYSEDGSLLRRFNGLVINSFTAEPGQPLFVDFSELGLFRQALIGATLRFRVEAVQGQLGDGAYSLRMTVRTTNPHPYEATESAWQFPGTNPHFVYGDDARKGVLPANTSITDVVQNPFGDGEVTGTFSGAGVGVHVYRFWNPGGAFRVWTSPSGSDAANTSIKLYRPRYVVQSESERNDWFNQVDYLGELRAGATAISGSNDWFQADRSEIDAQIVISDPNLGRLTETFSGDPIRPGVFVISERDLAVPYVPRDQPSSPGAYALYVVVKNEQGSQGQYRLHVDTQSFPPLDSLGVRLPLRPTAADNASVVTYPVEDVAEYHQLMGYLPIQLPEHHAGYLEVAGEANAPWQFALFDREGRRLPSGTGPVNPPIVRRFEVPAGSQLVYLRVREGTIATAAADLRLETTLTADAGLPTQFSSLNAGALAQRLLPTNPLGDLGGEGLSDGVAIDAIGKVYRFSSPAGQLKVGLELVAGSSTSVLWGLYAHGRLLAWDRAIPGNAASQTMELWLPKAELPGGPNDFFTQNSLHPLVLFVKHASGGAQPGQYRITVDAPGVGADVFQEAGSSATPLPVGAVAVGTNSSTSLYDREAGDRWMRFVVPDGHSGAMVVTGLPASPNLYPLRYDLYDASGSELVASGLRQERGDLAALLLPQVEAGKAYLLRFTGRDQPVSFPLQFGFNLTKDDTSGNQNLYSVPSNLLQQLVTMDQRASPNVGGDFEMLADFAGKERYWIIHDVENAGPARFTVTVQGANNLRLTVYVPRAQSTEFPELRPWDYMNEAQVQNTAEGKRLVLETFLEPGVHYIEVSRSNTAGGSIKLEAETPEYRTPTLVLDPNQGLTFRENLGIVPGGSLGTQFFRVVAPEGSKGEATFTAVDLERLDGVQESDPFTRRGRLIVTVAKDHVGQVGQISALLSARLNPDAATPEKATLTTLGAAAPFTEYLIAFHGEGGSGRLGVEAIFDVPKSGTPDLVVERVELHPNGGQTLVEITVRNRGYAVASSTQARFSYPTANPDSPIIAERIEGTLGPQASRVHLLDWVDPVSPEDVVSYQVDVAGQLEEVSEANNVKSVAMKTVNAHRPTVSVTLAHGRDGNADPSVWGRYVSSLGHASAQVKDDIIVTAADGDDAADTYDAGAEVYEVRIASPLSNGPWWEKTQVVLEDKVLSGLSPTSASNPNRFTVYVKDRFGLRSPELVRTIQVVPFPQWLSTDDSELTFVESANRYDIEFLARPIEYSKTLSQMLGISVPFVGSWKNEFIVEAHASGSAGLNPDAADFALVPTVQLRLVAMNQEILSDRFGGTEPPNAAVSVHGQVNIDARTLEANTLEVGFALNRLFLGSFEGPEIPIFGFDAAVVSAAVQAQVIGSAYADAAMTLAFDLQNGGAPLGVVSPTFIGLDLSLELRFEGELEVLGFDIASVGGGFIFTLKPRFGLESTNDPVGLDGFFDEACFELSATVGGELSADVLGIEVYSVEFESDPIRFTDCDVAEQALALASTRHTVTHRVAVAPLAPPNPITVVTHKPLGTDLIGTVTSRPSPQLVVHPATGEQLYAYLESETVNGQPLPPALHVTRGTDAAHGAPTILTSPEFISRPLLAATNDGSGFAAVLIYQSTPVPDASTTRDAFFAGHDLKYRYYDGTAWSEELSLTNDANPDMQASVAFNAAGRGVVAWVKTTTETPFAANGAFQSGRNDVFSAIWNPTTHRFGNPVRISSQSSNDSRPAAFVSSAGVHAVTWINGDTTIYLASSTGGSWSSNRVLLNGVPAGTIREVALGSESSGKFNVVMSYQVRPEEGRRTLSYVLNRSGSLEELRAQLPWEIIAETGGVSALRAMTAPDGGLHLTWHERSGSTSDLMAVRRLPNSTSAAWSPPVRLTQSRGDERNPVVTVAPDGGYRAVFELGSRFFATADGKPSIEEAPTLAVNKGSRALVGSAQVAARPEFVFVRPITFAGYAYDLSEIEKAESAKAGLVPTTQTTALAGQIAWAESEIANTGSTAGEVTISYIRGIADGRGSLLSEQTIRLGPGARFPIRFAFPVKPGQDQLTLRLTPAAGVVEVIGARNNAATATIAGLGDLAIENLKIGQGSLTEAVPLSFDVRNRSGETYSGPVNVVAFWSDPAKPGSREAIPLARPGTNLTISGGGTLPQSATVTLDRTGLWLLGVEIRAEGAELTLGNNVNTVSVDMRAAVGMVTLVREVRDSRIETPPLIIQVKPGGGSAGATARIVVTNTGPVPIRGYELKLFHWLDDGDSQPVQVFTQSVTAVLNPGDPSAPLEIPAPALAGTNRYRATVGLLIADSPRAGEADTTDNAAETSVVVQGLPDVAIRSIRSSISGSPPRVRPGQTLRLDVQVENLGIAAARQVTVEVFAIGPGGVTGLLVGRSVLASVGALGTSTAAVTIDTGKLDTTTQGLEVVIDRAQRLLERSDRNNAGSIKIEVLPPVLQVTGTTLNGGAAQRSRVTSISFDFNRTLRTNVAVGNLTVTNLGTGEVLPGASMAVRVDSVLRRVTWTFPGLSNETLLPGDYEVRLKAGAVSDTSANALTRDVVIRFTVTPGDATGDGRTNERDYAVIWRQLRKPEAQRDVAADMNGDGKVDAADLEWVKRHYGTSGASRPELPNLPP